MDFTKVEFDDDLSDMEADELRELVTEYQEAQSANLSAFDEVADTVEEFESYDSQLAEEVLEYSSLSEESAKALSFADKQRLLADLNADDGDEADEFDEGDEGGEEFEDRGTKGSTHGDEGTPDFIKDAFESIDGVSF